MRPEIYQNRRVAVIFRGPLSELPSELSAWDFSDLDAFYGSLDIWCPESRDSIEMYFSAPKLGIPQHVANIRDLHVGTCGKDISDDTVAEIKRRYLECGYDVLIIADDHEDFTESEPDNKVRIIWN